ncbi:hypothetical protein [Microbacterium aurum]|nr:hypothetical protein [Microbacterium aurum]MBM7826324.1 hypothetical protein [Microbacterium aurum]
MRRALSLAALGAITIALASGCASTDGDGHASTNGDSGMPSFSGPFAAEYQEAWQRSETDAVRGVLQDGHISDQEWSQVLQSLKDCLSSQGITVTSYNEKDGSYESNVGEVDGDSANASMGKCEVQSGEPWIGRLYRAQTSNPENIPETQLLTDCLVRNHAVPESYTVEKYLEDAPTMKFPFIDEGGEQTFALCNQDTSYTHTH